MRILPCLFLLVFNFQLLSAAPPEKVLPLSKALYPLDYYQRQTLLWQSKVKEEPSNTQAWLNYYTAARNANILTEENNPHDLSQIVLQLKDVAPNSFEAHYLTYWHSSQFDRRYDALLKAYALAPMREEIAFDMLHYYHITAEATTFQTYCYHLYERNLIANGVWEWNYNALSSVRENGVLLTQAENDTYPAWMLQTVKRVRTDVSVINIYDLLADAAYRQRVFQQMNIPAFQRDVAQNVDEQLQALLVHFSTYTTRPLHLGVATPLRQRSVLDDNLYLTGLAFEHSNVYLDNLSVLEHNFTSVFLTEQLENDLLYQSHPSIVHYMNLNYLPALALLHKMYQDRGEETAANRMREIALDIADRAGKKMEVDPYFFYQKERVAPLEIKDYMRVLDKNMEAAGSDNNYASRFEVSRAEYLTFLASLQEEGKDKLLDICQIHPTDWRSLLPETYRDLPEEVLFKQGNPEDMKAPVSNISYEGAVQFCEWLTKTYNASDHRRKRFQEVRFHLPSASEWEVAALGGHDNAPYPWGGPYNQNAKGCYLNNFNPYLVSLSKEEAIFGPVEDSESPGEDGGYFTVPVDAYFPNDFGLYNMSGNVSEMIDIPGQTKGGGWQDPSYYTQIGVNKEEKTPNANVGFRIFMTVIKE